MHNRRDLLRSLLAGALLPRLGAVALAGTGTGAAAAAGARVFAETSPAGRLHVVNGWIVTEADLAALERA